MIKQTRREFGSLALGGLAGATALSGGLISSPAFAQGDIPAGTVIEASNVDSLLTSTFEGKALGDMLTEKQLLMIKNYGLKLTLANSKLWKVDPRYAEWTEKNRTAVTLDPTTRLVSGWQAGMPFPDIDAADPQAGLKVIWNFFYGQPIGQYINLPRFGFLLVDGNSGLERVQEWRYQRFYLKNRYGDPDNLAVGSGEEFHRTLLFATSPFDIKGIGTYAIRYDSPKFDDTWAYLRSVRRVRRLSGGSWMDPIGGTDQLQDDIEIFNAHPTWYPDYKYLGKRWMLSPANTKGGAWNDTQSDPKLKYPNVDLSSAPYWNPIENYEPREVHVVECITPPEHPYSKKIFYIDAQTPRPLYGEAYDRAGEFWKYFIFITKDLETIDGTLTQTSSQGHTIDLQRMHATIFVIDSTVEELNRPTPLEAVNLGVLEKEAGT